MTAIKEARQWARQRRPASRKRRNDLGLKIEAAGLAIAAGVDLTDLMTLDQVALAAAALITTPEGQRAARRRGFDIINSAPRRATTQYETRELAAAGYHILRAGFSPGRTETSVAIGALAIASAI